MSVIYNRHKLVTCKQDPTQSVDTFMQELQRLGKSCNFEAVSAEENKLQYIRDAFISGISSPLIRQRLLESNTLTMDEAFNKARALEQAQKHSASYESNVAAMSELNLEHNNVAAIPLKHNKTTERRQEESVKEDCFFCGNQRHPRSKCPARESECRKCKKTGHWAKVCKSQQVSGAINSENGFPALA